MIFFIHIYYIFLMLHYSNELYDVMYSVTDISYKILTLYLQQLHFCLYFLLFTMQQLHFPELSAATTAANNSVFIPCRQCVRLPSGHTVRTGEDHSSTLCGEVYQSRGKEG